MPQQERGSEPDLPGEVVTLLEACGIGARDEVALRRALEERVPGYNLFRLTPAAAGMVYLRTPSA
jgi:hypothetical protein